MTSLPKAIEPKTATQKMTELSPPDLNDLCDATALAIESGGGFGWLEVPERDVMERFWQGVVVMPSRHLYVARLDDVICGTAQLILPTPNNEAQSHAAQLASVFIAPWARGHKLGSRLVTHIESDAKSAGYKVINLDVRETQSEAIAIFEKLGYQKLAEHPFYAEVKGKSVRGLYYYKAL